MKKVREYFSTMGYLFLPPTVLAYDKQMHGSLAAFLTVPTFFIPQSMGLSSVFATLISIVSIALIGFGIEFYQKWFAEGRHFDVKDATIMIKINLVVLTLLTILTLSSGTYTI